MDDQEIEEKLGKIKVTLKPRRDFERPNSGKTLVDFECNILFIILLLFPLDTKTMQQDAKSNVKSRPISGISRPKSAFSTVSVRTMKSINKKIPDRTY